MKPNEHSEFDESTFFEKLEWWLSIPKANIVHPQRITLLNELCEDLQRMLDEELIDAIVHTYPCPLGMGDVVIAAEMECLIVRDVLRFCGIMRYMSNFEIYPLEDGRIRFAAVFGNTSAVIPLTD